MKRLFNKKSSSTTAPTNASAAPNLLETSSTPPPQPQSPGAQGPGQGATAAPPSGDPHQGLQGVPSNGNSPQPQFAQPPGDQMTSQYDQQPPGGARFAPAVPQGYAVQMVPQLVPVVLQPPRVSDVTNAIGWSCAAPQFDFTYVLALADHISLSSFAAKDAAKALRKEFKHAVPLAQERAIRLTGILARNADHRFRKEIASKKFLSELEHLATNKKTEPQVKDMTLRVLSPLAYDYSIDADLKPVTALYNKLKPPEARINGEPLDPEDDLFTPTSDPRMRSRGNRTRAPQRVPTTGDQMKELRTQAEQARGYARMLNEAVAFAKGEEDLQANEIVQEFHTKCFGAQDYISQNLHWATVQAEQSRVAADHARSASQPTSGTTTDHQFASNNPFAPIVSSPTPNPPSAPSETDEEKTLAVLLAAHTEVIDALSLYDDRQRHFAEARDLHQVEARSRVETRFDRSQAGVPDQNGDYLNVEQEGGTGSASGASGHRHGCGNGPESAVMGVGGGSPFADPTTATPKDDRRASRNPYAAFLSSPTRAQGYSVPETVDETRATVYDSPTNSEGEDPHSDERSYGQIDAQAFDSPGRAGGSSSTFLEDGREGYGTRPRASTQGSSESSIAIPLAPSEKALGKLRRVSVRQDSETDTTEQQKKLEEQLRIKYQAQYEEEQDLLRQKSGSTK